MILSDRDIYSRLADGSLVIDPLTDPGLQIQPASIDLTLADEVVYWRQSDRWQPYESLLARKPDPAAPCILPAAKPGLFDTANPGLMAEWERRLVMTEEAPYIDLYPGAFVLASTRERVRIPNDLSGRVEGRSSLGRIGLVVHLTAGYCDPGFEGHITLEIAVVGDHVVRLRRGLRISQLVLTQLTSACLRPYGQRAHSKYQGQSGPTLARWSAEHPLKG